MTKEISENELVRRWHLC